LIFFDASFEIRNLFFYFCLRILFRCLPIFAVGGQLPLKGGEVFLKGGLEVVLLADGPDFDDIQFLKSLLDIPLEVLIRLESLDGVVTTLKSSLAAARISLTLARWSSSWGMEEA